MSSTSARPIPPEYSADGPSRTIARSESASAPLLTRAPAAIGTPPGMNTAAIAASRARSDAQSATQSAR